MARADHLRPIRLFDISQGQGKPTDEERLHLRECEECQTVILIFARQFTPKDKPEQAA